MLKNLTPLLTITALIPLAYTSAVNIALGLNTGSWFSAGHTQGFCDIGASGGRNQFLYAASGDYKAASQQQESDLQFSMEGPGVICSLDKDSLEVYADYWGGGDSQPASQCTGAMSGEQAVNFCAAHGFKDADETSFLLQCPGFPMEP